MPVFFVTSDGVTINMDSPKALNTVVGHEITHVLEGSDFYAELKEAIFKYAKTNGDYQSRYDAIKELYKDVKDANIENELTAELVGDYLFTDAEFVNRLSAENRNLFQKIYDAVKRLCKYATAGSKEARQLEKVKNVFEKAYRDTKKSTVEDGGVKYDISENFDKQLKSWDGKTIGFSFVVGTTSNALQQAGIPNKQIRWDASKIKTILNSHSGMNINTIAQIPELLENPVVVIDSKQNDNSRIVMGELYDNNGKIVTAILLLTPTSKKGNQLDIIKISSAQGRGHVESLFRTEDGKYVNIRYVDKKRIQEWLNVNRLQLPLRSFNLDSSTNSIPENEQIVKGQNSLSAGNASAKSDKGFNIYGDDIRLESKDDIAPIREDLKKNTSKVSNDDIAPIRQDLKKNTSKVSNDDIAPIRQDLKKNTSKVLDYDLPIREDLKNNKKVLDDDLPIRKDIAEFQKTLKSFNISNVNDTFDVQKSVYTTLTQEGFFDESGVRTVENNGSGMIIEINESSIEEAFSRKNFGKFGKTVKRLKLETIRAIPDVIETGKLLSDNVNNYHNDNSGLKYAYIEGTVEVDGTPISVEVTVRKSLQKNKFWMHRIVIKEDTASVPAGTSQSSKTDYLVNGANSDIVTQGEAVVKNNDRKILDDDIAPIRQDLKKNTSKVSNDDIAPIRQDLKKNTSKVLDYDLPIREDLKNNKKVLDDDLPIREDLKKKESETKQILRIIKENVDYISTDFKFDVQKSGNIKSKFEKISEYVLDIFNKQGNIATNPKIGKVDLVRSGAKSTSLHGYGENKLSAVPAIKTVIEKGDIIKHTPNYESSGVDRYVIAAKGKIGGQDAYLGVVIKSYPKQNHNSKFYLHEVEMIEAESPIMTAPQLSVDTVSNSASNNSISDIVPIVKKSEENSSAKSEIKGTPFEKRDIRTVGDKSIKAFMSENPEIKHFFQDEARTIPKELETEIVKYKLLCNVLTLLYK